MNTILLTFLMPLLSLFSNQQTNTVPQEPKQIYEYNNSFGYKVFSDDK